MKPDLYHLVFSPAWEDKMYEVMSGVSYDTSEESCYFDGAYLTFSAHLKSKKRYVSVEGTYPVTACKIRDFDYLERQLQDWIAERLGERALERGRPTDQGNRIWHGQLFGFINASALLLDGDFLEFRYKGKENYYARKQEADEKNPWHFRFIHPSELPQQSPSKR